MGFLSVAPAGQAAALRSTRPAGCAALEGRGRSPALRVVAQAGRAAGSSLPVRAADAAARLRSDITSFPGEDAPGTGRRARPDLAEERVPLGSIDPSESFDTHQNRSSADYYAAFPGMARASCPLNLANARPTAVRGGVLEPHAGPRTGKRVPPEHVADSHPESPDPHAPADKEMRMKAVADRRPGVYVVEA